MNDLLGHDHRDLGESLSELFAALNAGDVEKSHARLDRFWARLAMHIRAEHLHLFPTILRTIEEHPPGADGDAPSMATAHSVIAQLRHDHDFFMHELAEAIKALRALRANPDARNISRQLEDLRERVAALSRRLEAHNELEEKQVYRWTDALLAPAESADLAARVREELDNLPPRFTDADANNPRLSNL